MLSVDVIKRFLLYYLFAMGLLVLFCILGILLYLPSASTQNDRVIGLNSLVVINLVSSISSMASGLASLALITTGVKVWVEDEDSYSIFMPTAILSLCIATGCFLCSLILGQSSASTAFVTLNFAFFVASLGLAWLSSR